MVRLKGHQLEKRANGRVLFQFHSGSIKRVKKNEPLRSFSGFQFHSGSIKSRTSEIRSAVASKKFQFHSGSIKRDALEFLSVLTIRFQFHSGSIKSYQRAVFHRLSEQVSIP